MPEFVDSSGDKRGVNNTMRHQYRKLSDAEKAQMDALKDMGLAFVMKLHEIGNSDPKGSRQSSRELSIAQTKIEEAVMWGVKHITR